MDSARFAQATGDQSRRALRCRWPSPRVALEPLLDFSVSTATTFCDLKLELHSFLAADATAPQRLAAAAPSRPLPWPRRDEGNARRPPLERGVLPPRVGAEAGSGGQISLYPAQVKIDVGAGLA